MNDVAPAAEGQVADAAPVAEGQTVEVESTWYDSASDETKGYIQNKGWDDPVKTVEAYQNLEKFHGVPADQIIKLPKEGEPMDSVYDRLGRPDAAESYNWEAPDGFALDGGRFDMYKAVAYEAGISQAQFETLANADAEYFSKAIEAQQREVYQKNEIELKGLEKEWGTQFGERQELGRRFVSANAPEGVDKAEFLNKIEDAVGSAAMLKFFANASEKSMSREDRVPDGEGDRPFGFSPEQAAYELKELKQAIQADPVRLSQYNTGSGNDYDKVMRLGTLKAGG